MCTCFIGFFVFAAFLVDMIVLKTNMTIKMHYKLKVCIVNAILRQLSLPDRDRIKKLNKSLLKSYTIWISANTVQTLNTVIWYKLQPDIRDKKLRSRNFLGFCNVKNTWYKSLGFKGQPDIRTWFLGPDELFYLI